MAVQKTQDKVGRPIGTTKIAQVTPELMKLLRTGIPVKTACDAVGLSNVSYYEWMKKGELQKSGQYVEFRKAALKAKADAIARNVAVIQKAAVKQWQAAAWWLERTQPEEFGRHDFQKTEHSGGISISLQLQDCSKKEEPCNTGYATQRSLKHLPEKNE